MKKEIAIFAAGCFWGVEELFRITPGVLSTEVGYTGGKMKNPSYEKVCSDVTGHAEAVKIEYDASVVSYEKLLDLFWDNHNPMSLNRQGPDEGSQYRSAIFYTSPEQEKVAKLSKDKRQKSGRYPLPIVTEITRTSEFYRAEEYHQQYLHKRGMGSCHL